jgi:xylulokinase
MGVTQAAGLSLKWFRDNFCMPEKEAAAMMGVDPYDLMNREAEKSPIGSNLLFWPCLCWAGCCFSLHWVALSSY